jgi:TetR/AcrR family transcriptional regulator, mexJK operon transcriptional repressor
MSRNMIGSTTFCRLSHRRQALIVAARELFISQGFERTTLNDIVQRAGGSLATIYKLEAVVLESAASGEALIRHGKENKSSPQQTLHNLAQALQVHFLDPDLVALVRIVMARSISDPQFSRRFFARTATKTRNALESLFEQWQREEIAMEESPQFLAEMFMGLFVGDLHTQAISHGTGLDQSPERLRKRVDFFIKAAGLV